MGVEDCCRRVKIYATDLDQDALDRARAARYDLRALESVPEGLRSKYFQNDEGGSVFHGGLRRTVIFGRHDLVIDRPVSHVDLLFCRNTLMYFNVNAQTRVLGRFRDALNESGFLIIGRAEMLFSQQRLFVPVDIQHGVYSRAEAGIEAEKSPPATSAGQPAYELEVAKEKLADLGVELATANHALERGKHEIDAARALLSSVLTGVPLGICVLDSELVVQLWNDSAAEIWGLDSAAVVGRSLPELDLGFPIAELEARLNGQESEGNRYVTVEAAGRGGRPVRCHVTFTGPGHNRGVQPSAIVITTEPSRPREPWT
jgi:two-component system CheB/CheR fusion protein